jgi:hypothetical protein
MLAYGGRTMFVTMGVARLFSAGLWIVLYRDPEACCTADEITYLRSGDTARTSSPVNLRQWSRLFRFKTTWGMVIGTLGSQYLTWMYGSVSIRASKFSWPDEGRFFQAACNTLKTVAVRRRKWNLR